jgi:hypothetical protein
MQLNNKREWFLQKGKQIAGTEPLTMTTTRFSFFKKIM